MDCKQIDELNKLLENHGSTLTSFYDEGIRYGMKKGLIYGAIASFIGSSVIVVFDRLKSQNKKK